MTFLFWLFLASGFCGLVDELAWLRLAMASFGVTTPVISLFLSLFMGGLGAGSWLAGEYCGARRETSAKSDLRLYALCELLIGVSAVAAPAVFAWGRAAMLGGTWGTLSYYAACGGWLAAGLLPGCFCMGATIPLAMSALRKSRRAPEDSFSFLYLGNVAGAAAGSLIGAFVLFELLGFRGTLRACAAGSAAVAAAAFALSRGVETAPSRGAAPARSANRSAWGPLWSLFAVGCAGMAFEVVWTRLFGLFLGRDIYALGSILAFYLISTAAGAAAYRAKLLSGLGKGGAWTILGASALLPLLLCDPRFPIPFGPWGGELRLILGIVPVCLAMGFLTPELVDRWSQGDPVRAGRAYAFNVAGCIAGPLLAGLVLLPRMSERSILLLLALPFLIEGWRRAPGISAASGFAAALALNLFTIEEWQTWPEAKVSRDAVATVVAGRAMNGAKLLQVNGTNVTLLTPVTKMMAHLPLAFLARPPRNAIVICFGMGTTYRSLLAWGIPATAVELVPGVAADFEYFHPGAAALARAPGSRIVVDDGRRFLESGGESYDLITLDPPPPAEAPGNSLLYSREFYAAAKTRLSPDGILQQWHMGGDPAVTAAMARALQESFPYVRVFPSLQGFGFHFLASMSPIAVRTPEELARRLPPAAAADLVEWQPDRTPVQQLRAVVSHEMPLSALLALSSAPALTDDRPGNEYYRLRRLGLLAY